MNLPFQPRCSALPIYTLHIMANVIKTMPPVKECPTNVTQATQEMYWSAQRILQLRCSLRVIMNFARLSLPWTGGRHPQSGVEDCTSISAVLFGAILPVPASPSDEHRCPLNSPARIRSPTEAHNGMDASDIDRAQYRLCPSDALQWCRALIEI